ncbi:hypothetical protein M514_19899 [Trichuris suis]|uniref:Uncharacterized protein n=1 Tax=Trichuris suis TaxID=68888 RepID=A0A085NEC0_9BILA|nr:hypothetical protein M514_19899 [Trichuris suis]
MYSSRRAHVGCILARKLPPFFRRGAKGKRSNDWELCIIGQNNIKGKEAGCKRVLPFVFCYFHREFRLFKIWVLSKSRSIEHFNLFAITNYSRFLHIRDHSTFIIPTFSDVGPLNLLRISILRSMRPFDFSTYSTLHSIRRFDKFGISTVRFVNPSNLSTNITFRTIVELGPFEILRRSRTQSSERRLQENNKTLRWR